jgi:preprotein translocase subunit Sss1
MAMVTIGVVGYVINSISTILKDMNDKDEAK